MKSTYHIPPFVIVIIVALSLLASCNQTDMRQDFYDVEECIVKGTYEEADSILNSLEKFEDNFTAEEGFYWNYLRLYVKFVKGSLSEKDFYVAENLKYYFKETEDIEKLSKTYLFIGEIYRLIGDNTKALNNFFQAKELIHEQKDNSTNVWINIKLGELYLSEHMYDKCADSYQEAYNYSIKTNDTIRIALAALYMGKAFTIQNNVDSVIYYYEESIRLADKTNRKEFISPYAKMALCDIYIQIEEYDKALALMPRDSLNTANWAYWHCGQNHVDSAMYYFKELLRCSSLRVKAEALHMLIDLSKKKNDEHQSLVFSGMLVNINDSLEKLSQIEDIRRTEAQHKINIFVHEQDKHHQMILLSVLAFIILIVLALVFLLLKKKRQKYYCKKQQAKKKNIILRTQTDTQDLESRVTELHHTEIYRLVMENAGKQDFHLTNDQWMELQMAIENTYKGFTLKLMNLAPISEIEKQTCYLIKIGVSPVAIAEILFKTKSSIAMMRRRLYKKLTGEEGTPQQLDEFIQRI